MADVDAWMPIWIGDYLADTQDLTTEEHGAYMLLLMTAWRSHGRLPAAPERLARITKLNTKDWAETWKALGRFFQPDGDEIVQRRLVRELEAATSSRRAASERGKKGAAARYSSAAQGLPKQQTGAAQAELEHASSPSPSPSQEEKAPSAPARDLWTAWRWYEKFKLAWRDAKNSLTYGDGDDDAKATGELGDKLKSIPEAERLEAQEIAPRMLASYFGLAAAASGGHPWKWFVQRFNALRAPVGPRETAPLPVRAQQTRDAAARFLERHPGGEI